MSFAILHGGNLAHGLQQFENFLLQKKNGILFYSVTGLHGCLFTFPLNFMFIHHWKLEIELILLYIDFFPKIF